MKHLVYILIATMVCAHSWGQSHRTRTKTTTTHTYETPKSYVNSDLDYRWANAHGPWDFSGMLGYYSLSGFGMHALAAYRVVDNIIPDMDESLSAEAGVGLVFWNGTVAEIPVRGRWDFRVGEKFTVGPTLGFSYLSSPGGFFGEFGGFVIWRYFDQIWFRGDLRVGGFTSVTVGAMYTFQ